MTGMPLGALEFRLRQALPLLTLFIAALLDLVPAGGWTLRPALVVAATFYWALHRPELVPPPALFLATFLVDLVGGGLVGITPLTMLLLRAAVVSQRRLLLAASPVMLWLGFVLFAASCGLVGWLLAAIVRWHWQAPLDQLATLAATLLAWPFVATCLGWVNAGLPKVRHASGD